MVDYKQINFCNKSLQRYPQENIHKPELCDDLYWYEPKQRWEGCITKDVYCGYAVNSNCFFICRRCAQKQGLIW